MFPITVPPLLNTLLCGCMCTLENAFQLLCKMADWWHHLPSPHVTKLHMRVHPSGFSPAMYKICLYVHCILYACTELCPDELSLCTNCIQMYSAVPTLFKCTQLCPNACPNVPTLSKCTQSVQMPNVPTLSKCTQSVQMYPHCPNVLNSVQVHRLSSFLKTLFTYIQPNYICKLYPTFLSSALSLSTQLALVPYVSPLCSLTTSALFSAMQAVYNGY